MWQLFMSKGERRQVTAVPLRKPSACRILTGCPYYTNVKEVPQKGPPVIPTSLVSRERPCHWHCTDVAILAVWVSNIPCSKRIHKHSSDQPALYLPKCGLLSASQIYCQKTVPLGLNQLLSYAFVDSCHVSLPVYELKTNAESKVKRWITA